MPMLPLPWRRAALASLAFVFALATACAHADCISDAAARHQVNAEVLRAIGWQESRLQPAALGHNANGSIDVGAFQINSVHLSELGRYGIGATALSDGCISADVAAWHYRGQIEREGDSWRAIGAYHSRTPARAAWYANQIASILMRWRVLPAGALPFPVEQTLAPRRSPLPKSTGRASAIVSSPPSSHSGGSGAAAYGEVPYLPSPR